MSKTYSSDLRERVVTQVNAGYSRREVARRFGVSPSFVVKLMQLVADTSCVRCRVPIAHHKALDGSVGLFAHGGSDKFVLRQRCRSEHFARQTIGWKWMDKRMML